MDRLAAWIARHQVVAFVLITFGVTWPVFFLVYLVFPGNQLVEALFAPVVFSPALAAMLISGVTKPEPRHPPSGTRRIVFAVVWIAAAAVGVVYYWLYVGLENLPVKIIFNAIFALFPAWVISSAYARNPGIREHFSTLLRPRGPVVWYLVIFLIFPGVQLLDVGITRLSGGDAWFILDSKSLGAAAIFLTLEFMRGFFETGGVNEESGWRGFMLPRLQARYPVIVSVIIVWFFWAGWHLPYDFGQGVPLDWIIQNRVLWNLVFSILFAWVYNRTRGSILAPALMHPAMNTFGNNLGSGALTMFVFAGLAIFAVIYDKMWKKLPAGDPAMHDTSEVAPQFAAGTLPVA